MADKPKRKPGRPTLPDDEKASSSIRMRVHRRDKARWTATASREGKNLTAWIRETLNNNSRFDDE